VIQAWQEDLPRSDQFWLTKAQLKRIERFFPRTRGIPRVDDRRVVTGIIYAYTLSSALCIAATVILWFGRRVLTLGRKAVQGRSVTAHDLVPGCGG
jgi:hypothetical protein